MVSNILIFMKIFDIMKLIRLTDWGDLLADANPCLDKGARVRWLEIWGVKELPMKGGVF